MPRWVKKGAQQLIRDAIFAVIITVLVFLITNSVAFFTDSSFGGLPFAIFGWSLGLMIIIIHLHVWLDRLSAWISRQSDKKDRK